MARLHLPVAINTFGSWSRMAAALGVADLREHAQRIRELVKPEVPKGLWAKVQMLPAGRARPRAAATLRGKPPCQEVVLRGDEVDLTRLPVLRTWPQDGGPFITMPMVITRDPETGVQNIGMYRMQVYGPRSTGMHWQRHKGGAAHFRAYRKRGERMPVVALGGDPATMYTPTAPLPPGIDEYLFGGFLRREPVYTAKALTADLDIPAQAEIVLEGYVDPSEEFAIEGPFGDHTGFYTLEEPYPTFHVETVTMRRNAIYPATLSGVHRWRTCTWGVRPSAFSCRWRSSPCRRSWITTCLRRESFTIWSLFPFASSFPATRTR